MAMYNCECRNYTSCFLLCPADVNDKCTFQPLQLHKVCTFNVEGKNKDFENDTVSGMVWFEQKNTSDCNVTRKEVIVYKCEHG